MFQRFVGDALAMIEPLKTAAVQVSIEELVRILLTNLEAFLRKDDDLYLRCARHATQLDARNNLEPAYRLLTDIVVQHALGNPETRNIRDLQTFAWIFVNGGIALIVRHLTDPDPPITFEQLGNGLANMVGHYVRQENRLAAESKRKGR